MRILLILVTILIPTFIALTADANLEFLQAVGIFLQLVWSTVLLIHILSKEGLFSFDETEPSAPSPTTFECSNNYEQFCKWLAEKEDEM